MKPIKVFKAAVLIDSYKLAIFERHFTECGYTFKQVSAEIKGVTHLSVETANLDALQSVIRKANAEAQLTGKETK